MGNPRGHQLIITILVVYYFGAEKAACISIYFVENYLDVWTIAAFLQNIGVLTVLLICLNAGLTGWVYQSFHCAAEDLLLRGLVYAKLARIIFFMNHRTIAFLKSWRIIWQDENVWCQSLF